MLNVLWKGRIQRRHEVSSIDCRPLILSSKISAIFFFDPLKHAVINMQTDV